MEITKQDILLVLKDVKATIRDEWDLDDNVYGNGLSGTESEEYAEKCVDKAISIIESM